MSIVNRLVTVEAEAWETIKATFMQIANLVDDELVGEICESAIEQMEQLQEGGS
jgi:hypothetical protein